MLFVSEIARMRRLRSLSSATGKRLCRLANSRGTIRIDIGSTTICPRSTDCSPSFSDRASRSVACDTKLVLGQNPLGNEDLPDMPLRLRGCRGVHCLIGGAAQLNVVETPKVRV